MVADMSLLQRFRDWRAERRIRALGQAAHDAMSRGAWGEARTEWNKYSKAHTQRSTQAVARMERRMFR